ncbi:ABC transporter substrate-binding protein [Pseudidiomarina salinarum]|uniref:ABC transporter substrate-binding protein n=1 Tax=Pseudidiomarina salinarum TaxID=435908 RepID=A0A094ISN2_9GAMM|nr:FtsX-like permease family protein [Pseudidiomarina salinarum]KFZ30157.1 ABC transporter substrate-binding protein [Pseudidiomarina salinarum]RUO68660.1 ABC transporter substrate-binding protein [Pseudidiomarina salinarum]
MFIYYLRLAMLSLRKNILLTSLMITAIGLGIGAAMTTITVNYLMSADPIPHKSDRLFYVQLDNWDPNSPYQEPNEPPDQVTWLEATNLMAAGKAFRQSAMGQSTLIVEPNRPEQKPFVTRVRMAYADFFPMFDVPFLYGSGWTANDDLDRRLVVVLSKATNDEVFGGVNSVGENLVMEGRSYQVVGVLDDWHPRPKFFDLSTGAFNLPEDLYVPYSLKESLELPSTGNNNCWQPVSEDTFQAFLQSECVNSQFWVEFEDPDDQYEYLAFLDNYVAEQKKLGRFPRETNNRLSNVMDWMENQEVVAEDARMMMYMALMFLIVCLLNTVALLLAKFIGRTGEIALRRAVGASRRTLFAQHLIEAGLIGAAGGLLGLILAWLGLKGINGLYGDQINGLTSLDPNMIALAIGLAVISTILAGLYPTWRACSVPPAGQLKTQ